MNIRGNGRENDDIQTRHYSVKIFKSNHTLDPFIYEISDNDNKSYVALKMKYICTDEQQGRVQITSWVENTNMNKCISSL
jgi:hypothetical protein